MTPAASRLQKPKKRRHPDADMSADRFIRVWSGVFLAPLPTVIIVLLAVALAVGFSVSAVVWVVLAYVLTWVPMVVSYVLLRLLSWRSLRAYASVMFTVTFLPMLSVYWFHSFAPDARLSLNLSDGSTEVTEFSVTGAVIALVVAAVNAACMALFWRLSVRACADTAVSN